MAVALVCLCAALMCSCRPTDFFTEIIISPFADQVDETNPVRTVVNSPKAEQTSDQLAALDWTDEAKQSSEVQNIVTYSSRPTTNMEAYRSLYGLNPRFVGVESSELVRLDYTQSSTVENEKAEQPQQTDYSADQSSQLEGGAARAEGEQAAEQAAGTGNGEADNGSDAGKGGTDGASGGYNGESKIYNPKDPFTEPPKADKIAAVGQAAVMVEALGGSGTLCAIDRNTYAGVSMTESFAEVFGSELPDGFAESAVLWDSDGTDPEDLTVENAKRLAEACGQNGVILFDQNEGQPEDQYASESRQVLDEAGITFVPVDLTSVQGILDAASLIGQILPTSTGAADMADAYWSTVSATVSAAANAHGGYLAAENDTQSQFGRLSDYNGANCPVNTYQNNHIKVAFGTSYVSGIGYENGTYQLDSNRGLLFTTSKTSSPLSFWAQAAGVWNRAADVGNVSLNGRKTATAMLYGIRSGADYNSAYFYGVSSDLVNCVGIVSLSANDDGGQVGTFAGNGLGSKYFPYLIVTKSGSNSAEKVKEAVVAQMNSSTTLNPYSILPMGDQAPTKSYDGNVSESWIGSTTDVSRGSVFLDNPCVSVSDTVRANPEGLLGSWTGGSMECVLESLWLARIYSDSPANSEYEAIDNYSESQLSEAVTSFYMTFYRMTADEAQAAYDKVVTDKGL